MNTHVRPKISVIAHNIRSLWNVGAFFRTCDCFRVEKLYVTGYTAFPPRREISKTALGAEGWIPWEHADDPKLILQKLKKAKYRIVGLELTEDAVELRSYVPPEKICLIVGHEVLGVSKELLNLCDDVVQIPLLGKKESLNVSIAMGIALYGLRAATSS